MSFVAGVIMHYGYLAIFLLLVLGVVGLTIPIPDELLMLVVGYFTRNGTLDYTLSLVVAFIGSIIGMLVSYLIGKKAGRPFILKMGKRVGLTEIRFKKSEKWIRKYGPISILISYFIPGIRHITFYLCGVMRMRFKTYVVFASLGAFAWCLIFITVGRLIGAI